MPFSSVLFVHLFLPVFLAGYWLAPRRAKNHVAIAASLVFYAWGAPRFLPVVVGLGVIDFSVSHQIGRLRTSAPRRARLLLALGVTMHVSVLAYFKYTNFFVAELDRLFAELGFAPLAWTKVVLPIGVSFITFEEISYLTDVYRGNALPARRLSHYLLFLTLFPHSIAGPIFRWKDMEAQLAERTMDWTLARQGFERFAVGLAKKVLVADTIALAADVIFGLPAGQLTPAIAWLGACAYGLQIYFDFSGYSDMAIGLGQMIGFRFKENFDRPYISASITEFWTRWHISLSTWLRDYLYIPLGGNRRGQRRMLFNLMAVFAVSGLWHGAAWTFVLWGIFHGVFVVIERVLGERRKHIPLVIQHVTTLALVMIGWVFFRAGTAGHAFDMIAAMFGRCGAVSPPPSGAYLPPFVKLMLMLATAIALAPIATKYRAWRPRIPLIVVSSACWLLFLGSAIHLTNMRITPLIYFKF